MNEKIKFIDLFGGIGGFRLGLKRANTIIRSVQQKNSKECNNSKNKLDNRKFFSCVWYCDINKYAIQTYNKNFKEDWKPTDIRTVNPETIPDHDMLCAGFPCQSFSIAGKRKGFQDTRGTLFYEICRVAQAKRPRLLFLENVKGLLSADDGRCFSTILSSLSELGYDVEWQVLNSKNFGVPQNRERVFIIGHLRGKSGRQVFPISETSPSSDKWNPEGETASALQSPGHACGNYRGMTMVRTRSNQEYKEKDMTPPLRQSDKAEVRIIHNIYGGFNEKEPRVFEDHSPTIRTPKGGGHLPMICSRPHGFNKGGEKEIPNMRFSSIQNELVDNIRRLTPVECERLQSFPDNWTKGVSDTQRYKQLGNAVTVNVIQIISKKILGVIT